MNKMISNFLNMIFQNSDMNFEFLFDIIFSSMFQSAMCYDSNYNRTKKITNLTCRIFSHVSRDLQMNQMNKFTINYDELKVHNTHE